MVKAIQVIGFKGSGKSTLIRKLSEKLKEMGHTITVIKHANHDLDMNEKDKEMVEACDKYIVVSENNTLILLPENLKFLQIVSLLKGDFLIVEGFKELIYMPKIVCYENLEQKEILADGTELMFWEKKDNSSSDKIADLAKIVEEKGFLLAALDCGECGHKNCAGLVREIVEGKKSLSDCVPLNEKNARVLINGQNLPLSPFVAKLLVESFSGFLRGLKGTTQGEVEIKFTLK